MLASGRLARALTGLPVRRFTGFGFRTVSLKYILRVSSASSSPCRILYALGAPAAGARFTPPGGPSTLYMADDPETAFAEAHPVFSVVHAVDPSLSPLPPLSVNAAVRYHLDHVLDLTDAAIQTALHISPADFTPSWRRLQNQGSRPKSQILGQAVYDSNQFQAIWYESARLPGHYCLAVFPDRLTSSAFLEVHDPDGLVPERLP